MLDACVLYPAEKRNVLMWIATRRIYRARWSRQIHDEWTRAALARHAAGGVVTPERLQRTVALMNEALPDATGTGYEHLVDSLTLPDPGDRHVLAAAIESGSHVIVTENLSDFPPHALAPHGVKAMSADAFVLFLLRMAPGPVCEALRDHRASLLKPRYSRAGYLQLLHRTQLACSANALLPFKNLI